MTRTNCLCSVALGLFLIVGTAPLSVFAQASSESAGATPASDVDKKIADLEKQLELLKGEITALKSSATPAGAEGVKAEHALAATPVQSPTKPDPLAGITDVLGGAKLTGFVDTYYGVNFNQPATHLSGARSWDNFNNGLTLNMVNLVLDKAPDADNGRIGYHVSLGFGYQMNVINAAEPLKGLHNSPGWDQYLLEAYFSYLANVGKGLQVDVGKFVTPMGAEVVPTKDNWNYTRSLLYDYAIPLYHFGVRAKYSFNSKVALTGFVLNGWNNVIDNNSGKTGAVSLALTPTKKLSITQNYMFGPEQSDVAAGGTVTSSRHWRNVSDTTVAFTATPKLSLQTNIDYGRDTIDGGASPVSWVGAANYVRYAFTPRHALTLRHEYYSDKDGFTTGTPQHLHEVTATFERRFAGHIISRFEYRRDMSNRPIFFDHSAQTPTLRSQNTATVGLVYVLEKSE